MVFFVQDQIYQQRARGQTTLAFVLQFVRCCFFVGKPGHPGLAHNEAPVDSEFVTTGGFSQELLETQRKLRGLTQQRLGFREAEEEVFHRGKT